VKRRLSLTLCSLLSLAIAPLACADNPIIKDRFTADPAAMVYNGRVYLYTGHDEAPANGKRFEMHNWQCYSTDDMVHWKSEGVPLTLKAFAWARSDAWASQVIERNGKFYWYAPMYHKTIPGFSIGVGVSDSPTGPFKDARGSALITNDMTKGAIVDGKEITWDDIDPTVMIDDDKQAWLMWGNTQCYLAKLKENMTELDGPIQIIKLPKYTEAPWIHKYNGTYYLSYAYGFPEQIAYATASAITGPYTFRGVINDVIPNSPTNHEALIEFKNHWYFFYHNAALSGGGEYHRSVCVEEFFYNPDGSIRPITQDPKGVTTPPDAPATQPAAH
jgi:beta-xylosidase